MTNDPKKGAAAEPQPPQDPQATPPASTTATPAQETPATALTTQQVQDPASQTAAPPAGSAPPAQRQPRKDPLALFNPVRDRVVAMMNQEWFQKEASYAMQIINENSGLQKTDMQSRIQCMLNLANTGLTLNPVMRIAYLVPRKGRCKLEPSYMGLIKGVTDSGSVKLIRSAIVYEGDDFDMELGTTAVVRHKPYWLKRGAQPGEILGAYSVAVLHDGTTDVLDMGRDVLDKIKGVNESVKQDKFSPYTDWEAEMFRKAPIRRHVKTLPRTDRKEMERLMHMIALDEVPYGSTTLATHAKASEANTLRDLNLVIAEKLDTYDGNVEEIRSEIQQAQGEGRWTLEAANSMLAKITGGQVNG